MVGPITANAQSTTYTYQGDAFTAGSLNVTPPAGTTSVGVPPNIGVVPERAPGRQPKRRLRNADVCGVK